MTKKKPESAPTPRVWVSMTMPKDVVDQIDRLAEAEVRPRAQMIRKLLLRALAQNEKTA